MKPYYSLSDFPDRKSAGKNFVAVCPKCGTPHLSISKAKGVYHCFYAGCNFNGILTDFCKADRPMFPQYAAGAAGYAPTRSGNRYKTARNDAQSTLGEVPMLPSDYKPLTAEVMQKIKPLTDSPDCTDPDQLAARRYLLDQGISLATAITARIGCLRHYCITKDSENKSEQASNVFPCIAYVNYVDGHPVNAKYRSCSPSPSARQEEGKPTVYSKFWGQDSPTTPCAPYNIDCLNPLLVEEETIPRVIVVEGEKTRWCWQKPATDMSSAYHREPQATWANPSKRFSHGWNRWTTSWSAVTPTCPAAHSPSGCRTTSTPAASSSPCPADART